MMSYLWHYDGELDGTGRILTLESTGPGMNGAQAAARYRDVMDILDESHRRRTSLTLREDGMWESFMTALHAGRLSPLTGCLQKE